MAARYFCVALFCFTILSSSAQPLVEKEEQDEFGARLGRIVNGKPALPGSLTYQVSIQALMSPKNSTSELTSNRNTHFCGGSLVANNWILTAAHCALSVNARMIQVVEGAVDIADRTNPTYRVKRIISYDYNKEDKKGDLALMQLEPDPAMSSRLNDHPAVPVKLAPADFDPTNRDCTVSGWGRTASQGGDSPQSLMETSVRMVSQEGCAKMLCPRYPFDTTTDSMICAGGEDKDACQGDSGGPLVCRDQDEDYLVGIVSWGVGCATPGIPGVYTNVRIYAQWIQDQIRMAELEP